MCPEFSCLLSFMATSHRFGFKVWNAFKECKADLCMGDTYKMTIKWTRDKREAGTNKAYFGRSLTKLLFQLCFFLYFICLSVKLNTWIIMFTFLHWKWKVVYTNNDFAYLKNFSTSNHLKNVFESRFSIYIFYNRKSCIELYCLRIFQFVR